MQDFDLESAISKWEGGQLSDALMATLYAFTLSSIKFDGDFLQRKSSKSKIIDINDYSFSESFFIDVLQNYKLKKTKPYVDEVLSHWLQGSWRAKLITYIPTPKEVLYWQTLGLRPVTMLISSKRFFKPVLHKEDTLTFLTHDLEHAYKMNHDSEQRKLQINFFKRIHAFVEWSGFNDLMGHYLEEEKFKKDFDYLLSDMNTHPFHALKFFKGFLLSYFLRRSQSQALNSLEESEYNQLSTQIGQRLFFSNQEKEAFNLLNSQKFDNHYMPLLLTESFQSSVTMSLE